MGAKKLKVFSDFEIHTRQEVRINLFRNCAWLIHPSWSATLIALAQNKSAVDRAQADAEKKLRVDNPFITDTAISDYHQRVKTYEESLLSAPMVLDGSAPMKFK